MIELRQANSKDFKFLYKVKKKTLKESISKTWGWDEGWQKDYFARKFQPELNKIIIKSGRKIGCISIIEEDEYYFLSLIEILPKYQNQGIGSSLIKALLLKAERINKPVYLQVLKSNIKAQNLYTRLGFKLTEETETHIKMIYKNI
ncbi:MAG: GNAT family N-acetyltransferase [Promethearchaeota archaeon]